MHRGNVVRFCVAIAPDHIKERGVSAQIAQSHPARTTDRKWVTTHQEADNDFPHQFVAVVRRSPKTKKLLYEYAQAAIPQHFDAD